MDTPIVDTLNWVRPEVATWTVFSPKLQAEMSGSVVVSEGGYVIFDPLSFSEKVTEELKSHGVAKGIFLTNGNHERAAPALAKMLSVPVYAPLQAKDEVQADHWFEHGKTVLPGGFETLELLGFGAGETVFYHPKLRLIVLGDSLVHLQSRGLEVLPEVYCSDRPAGEASLKILASLDFDLACLAHGESVDKKAIEKLGLW